MTMRHARLTLPTAPGAIIGYGRRGPIRLQAGGDGTGDTGSGGDNAGPDKGDEGGDGDSSDTDDVDWEARAKKAEADRDKYKGLSRKHEERAKANADKAKRYDDAELAKKSDTERLEHERDEARKEAAEQKAELARLRAATKVGLPGDLVEFITADTDEEAEEQAKKLLARLGPAGGDGDAGNGQGSGGNGSGRGFDQGTRRRGAKQEKTVEAGRDLYQQKYAKQTQQT